MDAVHTGALMADTLPPLPSGFALDGGNAVPPLPPGFALDAAPQPPAGVLANVGAGANESIAISAGTPADIAAAGINQLSGMQGQLNRALPPQLQQYAQQPRAPIENPIGGSESIKSAMGFVGVDPRNVAANTTSERVARSVGESVPAMVAPYLGARAAIEGGATGFTGATARLFGGPGGPGQSGAATAAGALGNAAVGAGGAAGGQAAEALLPDNSPWKPLANFSGQAAGGGLTAGGMAAGKGVLNYAVRQAKDLLGPLSPNYRDGLVGDMLRGNASDPAALGTALDTPNPELVPGSKPTTFQLSGDMGIGQLERAARTQDAAPFLERAADQNAARTAQIGTLASENAAPASVRDLLQKHLTALDTEGEANVRRAQQNAQQAYEAAGGKLSPDLYGALMREQLEAAKASTKANESKLWKAIDPDDNLRISGLDVRREANRIFSETPKLARPAEGEEAEVFGHARMLPGVMPFNEFAALRGRLLGAIRDERVNGQTPALRRMQQLRESMDETIAGTADQAAQADAGVRSRISAGLDELTGTDAQARTAAGGSNGLGDLPVSSGAAPTAPGGFGADGNPNLGLGNAAGRAGVRTPPKPQDIVEFLTSRGGVRDDGGELRAMDMNRVNGGYGTGGVGTGSFGILSRKNGLPPDTAREYAEEAGYLKPGSTISDLFDAIHDSSRGRPHYSDRDSDIVANWDHFTKTGEAPLPPPPLPGAPANFDADAASRYRAAANATRERAGTFNNKIVGPVLQETGSEYRMLENHVPERFLSSSEGVQAFLAGGGNAGTLRDALAADLRRSATGPDGTLNPTRFASWRIRRDQALRAFPELQGTLGNAATAQQAVDTVSAAARQQTLEFQQGAARHFLNAEPTQAVQSALNGKNPVADLRELSRLTAADPEARAGLQRAIADHIARNYIGNTEAGTSGVAGMKSDAFQTFVRRSAPALRQVFSPEQIKTMQDIAADLQRSNRSIASSKIPGQSNTAQDFAAQSRLSVLGRSIMGDAAASVTGGLAGYLISGPTAGAASMVVAPAVKRAVEQLRNAGLEQTNRLLTEALLNPELARTLLVKASPNNRPFVAQRLTQHLGALSAAAGTEPSGRK